MTQQRNKTHDKKVTRRLELVHCDVVGPIESTTQAGFKCVVSFVDDYLGAIKNKINAIVAMKQYFAATAPYGNIQFLRCQNGAEFTS